MCFECIHKYLTVCTIVGIMVKGFAQVKSIYLSDENTFTVQSPDLSKPLPHTCPLCICSLAVQQQKVDHLFSHILVHSQSLEMIPSTFTSFPTVIAFCRRYLLTAGVLYCFDIVPVCQHLNTSIGYKQILTAWTEICKRTNLIWM